MKKIFSLLFLCSLTLGCAKTDAPQATSDPAAAPAPTTENADSAPAASDEIEFDSDDPAADSAPTPENAASEPAKSPLEAKIFAAILAFHTHWDDRQIYPPGFTVDADGKPLHSWRVCILPYLGDDAAALYAKIRLDEPWDSDWNAQFHSQIPDVFASPDAADSDLTAQGKTRFGVVIGEETGFQGGGKGLHFADIFDGMSNTVAIVERKDAVNWMAPDQELTFAQVQKDGTAFLNERPEGFVVGLFDADVQAFPKTVSTQTVVEYLTRSGAETSPETLELQELWTQN